MSFSEVFLVIVFITFTTVPGGEGCSDKVSTLCARHKRQGHCENQRWNRMMKNICQKTCNYCSGKKKCVDVNEALCRQHQRKGECDQPTFFTLNMCKKTCDFCSGRIKAKVPVRKSVCKDKMKSCKEFADKGLCDIMGRTKLRCKLSCNVCGGPKPMV